MELIDILQQTNLVKCRKKPDYSNQQVNLKSSQMQEETILIKLARVQSNRKPHSPACEDNLQLLINVGGNQITSADKSKMKVHSYVRKRHQGLLLPKKVIMQVLSNKGGNQVTPTGKNKLNSFSPIVGGNLTRLLLLAKAGVGLKVV